MGVFGGGGTPYLFSLRVDGDGYRAGVHDGWLRLPFWMMCVALCLAQLSTLCWKRPIFQPERKSSTPNPEKHPPSLLLLQRPPAPSCLLPLAADQVLHVAGLWGRLGAASAPVLRRHLFSRGMRACWCWQGGAEGWRGSVERALSHGLLMEHLSAPVQSLFKQFLFLQQKNFLWLKPNPSEWQDFCLCQCCWESSGLPAAPPILSHLH